MQKKSFRAFNILFLKILIIFSLLIISFQQTAKAAGSLDVTAQLTPSEFESSQKAEIILELTNTTENMLEDVKLSVGAEVDRYLGTLEPYQKRSFKISNFVIDQGVIGGSLDFSLNYVELGETKSASTSTKVNRKASKPKMQGSRSASKKTAAIGDSVTITYTLENTGDVDLQNVSISESLSNSPVVSGINLPVGSGKKTFEYSFVLKEKVKSSSSASATSANGENINVDLNSINFDIVDAKLELTALISPTQETAERDKITIDVLVKNTGNAAIKNINIKDELGENIFPEEFSLNQGEEKSIAFKAALLTDRNFVLELTGKLNGDQDYSISSSPIELKKEYSPDDIIVTIEASTINQELTAAGEVPFEVKITNSSPIELLNFVLLDGDNNILNNTPILPIGETILNINLNIDKTQEVIFKATYQDSNQISLEAASAPVSITLAEIVEETPKPVLAASGAKETWIQPAGDLIALFVGLILLIGGSIFGIIFISKKQKDSQNNNKNNNKNNNFDNNISEDAKKINNIKEKREISKQQEANKKINNINKKNYDSERELLLKKQQLIEQAKRNSTEPRISGVEVATGAVKKPQISVVPAQKSKTLEQIEQLNMQKKMPENVSTPPKPLPMQTVDQTKARPKLFDQKAHVINVKEQENQEQVRLEQLKQEQVRLENNRLDQEKLEKARQEQARLENNRLDQEKLEKARIEQARQEQLKLQYRLQQEKLEKERLEEEAKAKRPKTDDELFESAFLDSDD